MEYFYHSLLIGQCFLVVFIVYLLFRTLLYRPIQIHSSEYPPVSIIVPFRNEAARLPTLLLSLIAQNYPGIYEILLIDDQSTDASLTEIDALKKQYHTVPLTVIPSTYDQTKKLTSKQQALDCGVDHAHYGWLAFTDADMCCEKNWLTLLIDSAANKSDIVFGHTVLKTTGRDIFSWLQSFQLEFLFTIAYAFHAARLPGSCMGNNLLVAKKTYSDIGGQAGIGYSIVEDRDLLRKAEKMGHHITPTIPFTPSAQTAPCATLHQFFNQSLRWLKGGLLGSPDLYPAILGIGIQNALAFFAITRLLPVLFLWSSMTIIGVLWLFLFFSFRKTGSKENLLFFPVYYIFMLVETMVMIIPLLTFSPEWKQRKM